MFKEILDHVNEHVSLTSTEISQFTQLLSFKKLKKKEFLIRPSEFCTHQFFVKKGCLKVFEIDKNGNEHILQFAKENWWTGDFQAYFEKEKATLTIVCLEDTEVLGISLSDLEKLYLEIPKFERFFRIKLIGAFLTMQKRIRSSLEKSGAERYLEFLETYPDFEKRIPNYMIANYLGLKPESLSRIRKNFQSNH